MKDNQIPSLRRRRHQVKEIQSVIFFFSFFLLNLLLILYLIIFLFLLFWHYLAVLCSRRLNYCVITLKWIIEVLLEIRVTRRLIPSGHMILYPIYLQYLRQTTQTFPKQISNISSYNILFNDSPCWIYNKILLSLYIYIYILYLSTKYI